MYNKKMIFFKKNHGVFVRRGITMHKNGGKFREFWHASTIRANPAGNRDPLPNP